MTDVDLWMERSRQTLIARQEAARFWNDAKIAAILATVGQKHWRASLDRKVLANDLEVATKRYEIRLSGFDLMPTEKQLSERATQIKRLSSRLLSALPNPDDVIPSEGKDPDVFGQLIFPTADKLELLEDARRMLTEIHRLAAEFAASRRDRLPKSKKNAAADERKTANVWLIADEIPRIFERHFKSRPRGVSTVGGRKDPGGPALRFTQKILEIVQVTTRQQKSYQPAGIVEIWREAKRR